MALTQNERLIIKYVGQHYLTKDEMSNIIPCQTKPNETEYSARWLTKDGTSPLIPIRGAFYFVTDIGNVYQWNGNKYEQANLPDTLTAEEVTQMWGRNP